MCSYIKQMPEINFFKYKVSVCGMFLIIAIHKTNKSTQFSPNDYIRERNSLLNKHTYTHADKLMYFDTLKIHK